MAKFHGRLQTLNFSGDAVGGIEDGSYALERAVLDITDHDDAERAFISGRIQGTIDLTMKADSGDAGQVAIRDNITSGIGLEAFDMRMGDGRKLTGNAVVTSYNPSGPNDGVSMISASLQMSGTLTEAAV